MIFITALLNPTLRLLSARVRWLYENPVRPVSDWGQLSKVIGGGIVILLFLSSRDNHPSGRSVMCCIAQQADCLFLIASSLLPNLLISLGAAGVTEKSATRFEQSIVDCIVKNGQ